MTGSGRVVDDERGVSEFLGVLILVVFTVVITASVGLNVLVADTGEGTGPPSANFSFQYFGESGTLLITHQRGQEIPAGNLSVEGPENSASWAALAGTNETSDIGPGATVQISKRNAYGASVDRGDTIEVVYVARGNETVLDRWKGG